MLPFVDFSKLKDGELWNDFGSDLTIGSILINILLTDMYWISKYQGMGLGYIFGKAIAKAMKSIGQRTQMEAAMMSMFTIILGLVFMTIYIPFFTNFPLLMKIGTVVNTLAGMGFIGSYLVTSFQQYQSYMMVMGIIKDEQRYN